MKYLLIAKDNIPKAWPHVAPWILQAVEGGNLEGQMEQIREELLRGGAQLWVGGLFPEIKMVLVTEGMTLDNVPTLVLRMYAGAEVEENIPHLAVVEQWAVQNGYSAIQVWGRLGWRKKLRPLGYKTDYLVMSKSLKKELH